MILSGILLSNATVLPVQTRELSCYFLFFCLLFFRSFFFGGVVEGKEWDGGVR